MLSDDDPVVANQISNEQLPTTTVTAPREVPYVPSSNTTDKPSIFINSFIYDISHQSTAVNKQICNILKSSSVETHSSTL